MRADWTPESAPNVDDDRRRFMQADRRFRYLCAALHEDTAAQVVDYECKAEWEVANSSR